MVAAEQLWNLLEIGWRLQSLLVTGFVLLGKPDDIVTALHRQQVKEADAAAASSRVMDLSECPRAKKVEMLDERRRRRPHNWHNSHSVASPVHGRTAV